jgi:diguanylate cyclase (GGDEF)-like protein
VNLDRFALAHARLAQAVAGNETIGAVVASAFAEPFGRSAEAGFFGASRGAVDRDGIDAHGRAVRRASPSALDYGRWAMGGPQSGNAPFPFTRRPWIALRAYAGSTLVGGLVVAAQRHDVDEQRLRTMCEGFAAHAAAVTLLRRTLREQERLIATDILTGARSRSFTMRAVEEAAAARVPYLLFVVDLDGLKKTNDTRGHQAGDAMIMDAARALMRVVRSDEVVGRIGGDEFVVLVRAEPNVGAAVLSRLTAALEESGVAASIGWSPVDESAEATFERADSAMYAQKQIRKGIAPNVVQLRRR